MEFDQKEEAPFNIPEKKKTDKKNLIIYIVTGVISVSSLIYGYASYQASYFKDAEIQKLKLDLEEANTKLLRIDILENQVKELEASLIAKSAVKPAAVKKTKVLPKKEAKKLTPIKKMVKKTKSAKLKEKKPVKK
jgi:predicted ATP-grasp superfamily ATP-dependent carboligase